MLVVSALSAAGLDKLASAWLTPEQKFVNTHDYSEGTLVIRGYTSFTFGKAERAAVAKVVAAAVGKEGARVLIPRVSNMLLAKQSKEEPPELSCNRAGPCVAPTGPPGRREFGRRLVPGPRASVLPVGRAAAGDVSR